MRFENESVNNQVAMKKLVKRIRKVMIVFLSFIIILGISAFAYMQLPQFGDDPKGERLARIKKSPNYKSGKFENKTPTPTLAPGYTFWGQIKKAVFQKYPRLQPVDSLPSVKSDLLHLSPDTAVAVWFGHSSSLIKIDGKTILIDPVFSGSISPLPWGGKAIKGSDVYTVEDLPAIDYLIISHDHYDHLDYKTIKALKAKTKYVVCGLGVGAHFERWGYTPDQLLERDWEETVAVAPGFTIHVLPARHKSGRSLSQSQNLWASYLIQSPSMKIYYSGDGGYDTHFKDIGKKYGPIDLALLENGQYNEAWHYVHMLPDETIQAAVDLKAKRVLPVHNSKFILARHPWDEPLEKVTELGKTNHIPVITPMIGEVVNLKDSTQTFKAWWKRVK